MKEQEKKESKLNFQGLIDTALGALAGVEHSIRTVTGPKVYGPLIVGLIACSLFAVYAVISPDWYVCVSRV